MNTSTELVKQEAVQMDVAPQLRQTVSIASAFDAIIRGDIKPEHVQMAKELLAMDAKQKFTAAFVELQRSLPAIQGFRGVPDKAGNIKFVYANFDDIDEIVRPICIHHGFSYSFRETEIKEGRVTVTMTLQHEAGHSIDVPYSVRIGSGPPGATESQSDVSAHTYAKRGAIESGLSLRIVGEREDAMMEGNPNAKVSAQQAAELEHRAQLLNCATGLLQYAKAEKFSEIRSNQYTEIDGFLRRKEKGGK